MIKIRTCYPLEGIMDCSMAHVSKNGLELLKLYGSMDSLHAKGLHKKGAPFRVGCHAYGFFFSVPENMKQVLKEALVSPWEFDDALCLLEVGLFAVAKGCGHVLLDRDGHVHAALPTYDHDGVS